MLRLSYWVFPIVSGVVWLATLLGLLLYWIVNTHRRRYSSMDAKQQIAYISDVGASNLKPLFIAGCVITTVFLDISFLSDRWLRHRGRLVPNSTTGEKALSALTIVFALLGTVGLILLSIFDTARHPKLHDVFLLLFIAGYILSAIFICWEYQRLGHRYRDHRILRTSFWIKLIFVIVEVILAIVFVSCTFTGHYDPAAVVEWIISFIFSAYLFSFYVDLYPAVNTKDPRNLHRKEPQKSRYPDASMSQQEMEEGGEGSGRINNGGGGTTSSNSERNLTTTSTGQHHHDGVVQQNCYHSGAGDGYSNNF